MVITVDLDSNRIVEQPGVLGSPNDLTTPRATAVPLTVQFCRGGVIVDPESSSAEILTSSTGTGTIFYAPAHPFAVNDEISISGHTGLPIEISASTGCAQAVTFDTSTDLVTVSGCSAGDRVVFYNGDTLPSEITGGVIYYVIASGLTSASCKISTTAGGLAINLTGSPAGTHTAINLSRCLITTSADHGMTTGGNGTGANGIALAAGKFLVNIAGHDTAGLITGSITSASNANPAVVTTTAAHGLSTGDIITVVGSTRTQCNVTSSITVTGATTFTMPVVTGGSAGTGGSFRRQASDINGQHIATWVSATTFTIPKANYSVLTGGAMAVTTTTPTANTADGAVWKISAVTANTFTLNYAGVSGFPSMTLTAAGTGGIATKTTSLALRWTVKNDGEYDGDIVAETNTFTKYGSGDTTSFRGTCNYITPELNSLLGIEATTGGVVTGVSATDLFTRTTHGFSAGDLVVFTVSGGGAVPGGITAGLRYYVVSSGLTANAFKVSATSGGTAIDLTSDSTATVTVTKYPISNDETSATLMAELKWTGAQPSKTNWIRHYVRNDLYKGDESTPVSTAGRIGSTDIVNGDSEVSVTFDPILGTANWHFMGAPYVENTTASALGLSFDGLSAKSASGFTAILSGATDTAGTYKLRWIVQPD